MGYSVSSTFLTGAAQNTNWEKLGWRVRRQMLFQAYACSLELEWRRWVYGAKEQGVGLHLSRRPGLRTCLEGS